MKTKALLGALVVAVLAVFGVIGLRNAPDARAGNFGGATAFNPSTLTVGSSGSSVVTVFDDQPGTSSMMVTTSGAGLTFTASSVVLASNPTVSCAVSATGLAKVYPPEHKELASQIAELGAVVCESPLDQEPVAGLFPQRNRIISGMSLGVIIIEATRTSGALHTAAVFLKQIGR